MPRSATSPKPTLKHRAILPLRLGAAFDTERIQSLWPWYFLPFTEPDVSNECRAFVLGEFEPADDDERKLLIAELAAIGTIRADTNECVMQCPGAAAAVRGDYQRKGLRLLSPVAGESSGDASRPFVMWPPQVDDGHQMGNTLTDPFVGLGTVVESLVERKVWALAQLDAKIDVASEMAKEGDGSSRRYQRAIVAALRNRKRRLDNGIPTVQELRLFFLQFERLRLQAQQDARIKEQQALQERVTSLTAQEQQLAASIDSELAGGDLP